MNDMALLYIIVNIIIGILGFFLRSHIVEMRNDVKDIKQQTNITNGRVGVLEEWKKNHTDTERTLHDKIDEALSIVHAKLDQLWKGTGR